ncbi:hypothetical protein [Bacteroides fluxus]|uniref:hypothetical protein n=1 Tax=Bacteroides fluxus TaxID=626930 RepID=UPI0023A84189|nr:hypothetical protein [Bacteroides fluxus]
MKTRSMKLGVIASALLSMAMPFTAKAQDKVEASVGADLVSCYIWRGQDLGGVSLQPSASVAYKGFSLEAWGSVGFESKDDKELDLTLGYSTGGFSVSVTDYWFNGGPGYFHYGARNTAHVFEGQIGYDFGLLAINWYTNFAGADGVNKEGDRAYSSYLSLVAPFSLGGLDWTAEIGATPWATDFYGSNGFAVCDVSLGANKEIKITDSFSLPLFVKATWNPRTEGAYFVAGLSF